MNKHELKFWRDIWNNGKFDIYYFGYYRLGLSSSEIEKYIQIRTNKLHVKRLLKKFYKIAGINTCAVHICENCNRKTILMYRHDVKRFADKLLLNKTTYWD